jgi:hypothetical protein
MTATVTPSTTGTGTSTDQPAGRRLRDRAQRASVGTLRAYSRIMSIGSRLRSFRACGLALVLAVGGCGSDDQGAAQDSGTTSEATATVGSAADEAGEQDAGLGGAGHWTAGQLCALNDLASMSVLHPGVEVIEETGLDEADSAVCLWSDRAFDPIDSAGRLFIVSQMLHDGATFSDSF